LGVDLAAEIEGEFDPSTFDKLRMTPMTLKTKFLGYLALEISM
jgi:hypothetical protein